MTRFFVTDKNDSDYITLSGENAMHAKVLRLKPGETVCVCDGCGTDYICTVEQMQNERVLLRVSDRMKTQSEPAVKVSIYMAFAKGDKLEHVIQKATELGAGEIVVFPTARCVSRPDDKSLTNKLSRWQKIAQSASEQSCRGTVPQVITLSSYKDALKRAAEADMPILFYENEQSTTLKSVLADAAFSSVSLMTGPEGGFEESEVVLASDAGLHICTLGKRILRCETAPLCALSAVMYAAGEF